ncbi:uncharacterized GPI-anchored protein At4g28100-like [Abrus precatorius]|uniref:Uncharacterized GPI-anchored protein At4g28100-like n=1 Tax=Abrus precatorius TaxID=3816 RepID=A0A8B8LN65_ABRPR|nr:uncharacterized GPI-anchored protein At4g28100-like [Abrus precatorius]
MSLLPLTFPQSHQAPYLKTLFFCCILYFPSYMGLPDPAATTLKPIFPSPSKPTTTTIPAFPEQSDVAGCPLTLSNEFFDGIKSACGVTKDGGDMELHHSRCCPVLATWLYSAYSSTALGIVDRSHGHGHGNGHATSSYNMMPLLPDDSESCMNELGKALKVRGIELTRPNETCDVVYCFCGIRLHPLNCPDAFSLSQSGELVVDASVKRLEKNCLSSTTNVNGFPGLGGCSKCLNSLYLLNKKTSNTSKAEDRTTKIHNKDCELMGLTWLLAKNRTAYMHTVSAVLRALMLNSDGSDPQSCSLNSDGMPLAVDSSEISDHSSSTNLQQPTSLSLLLFLCLLLLPLHFAMLFS